MATGLARAFGTITANIGTIAGIATDTVLQAVRDRLPTALQAGRLDAKAVISDGVVATTLATVSGMPADLDPSKVGNLATLAYIVARFAPQVNQFIPLSCHNTAPASDAVGLIVRGAGTFTIGAANPTTSSRSDTFTGTGNGVTVDASANPHQSFSVQVKGTGAAPTSWTALLEGSLDNANFTTVLTHNQTTGDGVVLWTGSSLSPSRYFRSRVSALVLGGATNIVVTILGMP